MELAFGIDVGGTTVKGALFHDGGEPLTARSGPYAEPTMKSVRRAISGVVAELCERFGKSTSSPKDSLGLCLPGAIDENTGRISVSANAPWLVGAAPVELLHGVKGSAIVRTFTDVHAATHDAAVSQSLRGRVLGIALGTGVGAAVLDCKDGATKQLIISGRSSGHFGQLDVTLEDNGKAPIGPDGGRGGLEAYIGLPALMKRYDCPADKAASKIRAGQPPFRAIARAIRIAHAIYRPDHVRLLGGIGIRLGKVIGPLRAAVQRDLTRVARPDWTLECGTTDFHAAIGAARLAAVFG